jgi:glycerol-3-phosphate cytidylyltransferase
MKTANPKMWGIGFTCGSYDLLHAGHVLALKEASEGCEYLIVGLQSDPTIDRPEKNKPIQTLEERQIQLTGCRYVDDVIIYNTEKELYDFLAENSRGIDIRFLGEDWKGKPFTGHELPIPCVFTSRTHAYSSSNLRRRVYWAEKARKYEE